MAPGQYRTGRCDIEAVHGSGPDIAGKASPISLALLLLSG